MIKFTQNDSLKPYIDINTKKKLWKMVLKNIFVPWLIMQFLENLWKKRKHRDIKLVTTETRRNYLVSEPNYHTTKFFTGNVLAKEMKKSRET